MDSEGAAHLYGHGEYKIVINDSSGGEVFTWDHYRVEFPDFFQQTVAADYEQTVDDDYILVNTDTETKVITLLAAASWENPLVIKNIGANAVTITPNASETIDGDASYTLATDGDTVELISDESNLYATYSTNLTVDVDGNVGIGTASPSYPLDVSADVSGYAAQILNDGNANNRNGLSIQCGEDTIADNNYFIGLNDGNGTNVGFVKANVGQVEIVGAAGYGVGLGTNGVLGNDLVIDTSGNVGVGCTPETWTSAFTALQVGGTGAIWNDTSAAAGGVFYIGQNVYNNSGVKYIATDEASLYSQASGAHTFQVATSGTADAAISFTTAMTIGSTGLINMLPTYSNDMNGDTIRDMQINNAGELGYTSSTLRKKTNIQDMEDISWLYNLRPVNFEYKKKDEDRNYIEEGTGRKEYGLIAEEVESVNDSFVFHDDGRVEGVHYKELIPVLLKAIQDQQEQIDDLTDKVASLEKR